MAVEYKDYHDINPVIDAEFKAKIPKMPDKDREGLKADIKADKYIRDPLVIWLEENTLLDGHHRWEIKNELGDEISDKIPVDYKSFPDRWAAIAWICSNQLHKHNMTEMQRIKLLQEEYEARQKTSGAQIGNDNAKKQVGQLGQLESDEPEIVRNGKPGKENTTRPTIAKEHGISEKEVRTAVEVGRGIDKAEQVAPGFKDAVLSGEIKANKGDLAKLRKLDQEPLKQAVEAMIRGEKPSATTNKKSPNKNKQELSQPTTTENFFSNAESEKEKCRSKIGGGSERREMYGVIQKAYAPMLDVTASSTYNIDDLTEEIINSGKMCVESICGTVDDRHYLLDSEEAWKILSDAIEDVISKIRDGITKKKKEYAV